MRKNKIVAAVTALLLTVSVNASVYAADVIPAGNTKANTAEDAEKYTEVNQDNLKFRIYSDHAELAFCDRETKGKLVIPDEINGVSVTVIGESAVAFCAWLEEVVIPDTVSSVGRRAFACCDSLPEITVPDSVTAIGDEAFKDCSGLVSVNIGNSVKSIGKSAFDSCQSLKSVIIPESVTEIGSGCFDGCFALESAVISGKITEIPECMFRDCALKSFKVPESVTKIGYKAFWDCDRLTDITIPDSVSYIDDAVFENCDGLKEIVLPASLTYLGEKAFFKCSALKNISIPESLKNIREDALWGTAWYEEKLTEDKMVIVNGILLDAGNFEDTVTIPSSVTCIGCCTFKYSSFETVSIPDSVTCISDGAFSYCSSLKTVKLPASLESIETNAFIHCISLKEIIVPDTVKCIDEDKLKAMYEYAAEFPVVVSAEPERKEEFIHGDVNLDGIIDITDLTALSIILVDKEIPDDDHYRYGDVDYDGKVTLTDLALLRQYLSKNIVSLPEPKEVSYASYEARKKAREQAIKPDNPPTPSAVPSHEPTPSYSATPSPDPTGYFPLPSNAPGIMFGTDSIACKNTDQASEIISNYDTYNYSDNQKEFLAAMKSDGFLYAPDKMLDIAVTVNDECYLYATEVFGDINIEYCAKYRDFDYHVYICYADKELLKNSESEKNYLMEHFSFTGSKFMKIKGTNMYYTLAGIVFFIDENHYCYINTIDSRDNMLKFAENFSLKKISF